MRALGITGAIRHGSGIAAATFAAGIMIVGTDTGIGMPTGVTPMDVAMFTRIEDSMVDRPSAVANLMPADSTVAADSTAADGGERRIE